MDELLISIESIKTGLEMLERLSRREDIAKHHIDKIPPTVLLMEDIEEVLVGMYEDIHGEELDYEAL